MKSLFFFFFQAEDGIRDLYVTGVQTCALPIFRAKDDTRDGKGTTRHIRHVDEAAGGADGTRLTVAHGITQLIAAWLLEQHARRVDEAILHPLFESSVLDCE